MALSIKRQKDNRVVKCVQHRVADIPGGVTVSVAELGGAALFEGTPIGKGADGIYQVCKTAQILIAAAANATTYEVAKGHHFKVGDRFATEDCEGQPITAIEKSHEAKDVITVGATLGAAVPKGTCAFEAEGANTDLKVTPIAFAGSNMDVVQNDNLFVDVWVMGVILEKNAPIVNAAIKQALKCVVYV